MMPYDNNYNGGYGGGNAGMNLFRYFQQQQQQPRGVAMAQPLQNQTASPQFVRLQNWDETKKNWGMQDNGRDTPIARPSDFPDTPGEEPLAAPPAPGNGQGKGGIKGFFGA